MFKSAFALAASAFFSTSLLANGMVDYLQVDGDIVVFGTSGDKTNASPACAAGDKWTINLATDSGKANYALLMSAMSGKLSVEVGSAGDCADDATIERSATVTITGGENTVGELPTNYTSCADILRQNPGAQDGVYLIDPDLIFSNAPFTVYCDMTRDGGGWTLTARAKHGDTGGWTGYNFLNFQRKTDPEGGTFSLSTQALAPAGPQIIRIIRDSFPAPIFFKNHHQLSRVACNDVEVTDCHSSQFKSGHGGYQYFIADDKVHIITYATGENGWYVGDGTTNNYANGKGEPGTLATLDSGTGTFDTSFTMWVR